MREFWPSGMLISGSVYLIMKTLTVLLFSAVAVLGQVPAVVQPGQTVPLPPRPAPPEADDVSRFDLDFRGGPAGELVDAISKAMGKKVNVVISFLTQDFNLPPVRVRNATVSDVFNAVASATRREVPVGPASQFQFRTVQSQFLPTGTSINDDTVWSFVSNDNELADSEPPFFQLRYFQLRGYLSERVSVHDIVSALEAGWEMLPVQSKPQLRFHPETGILIAVAEAKLLDHIPQLLQQLPRKELIDAGATVSTRVPESMPGLGVPQTEPGASVPGLGIPTPQSGLPATELPRSMGRPGAGSAVPPTETKLPHIRK